MFTKERFERLSPTSRGYVVYLYGAWDEYPHIPDERNPYPMESQDFSDWERGQRIAVLEARDYP